MNRRTTLQGPGGEGGHAGHVARRRPGDLVWFPLAPGTDRVAGRAAVAAGQASRPRGLAYRLDRLGTRGRGQAPCCSSGGSQEGGRSACHKATNGADTIRQLQSALSRTSQQDKPHRFYRLSDKGWRAAVLWAAWRQGQAKQGAPGMEGMAIEAMSNPGDAEEMSQPLHEALREHQDQFALLRGVEMPQPQGGTRPLGIATVQDRVGQTAMPRVLAPICEAALHAGSSGYRPKRAAPQASRAMREDLDTRAWGGVEMDGQAYGTRIPPRQLLTWSAQRMADGSLLQRSQHTLTVGAYGKGQGGPTQGGGRTAPPAPRGTAPCP